MWWPARAPARAAASTYGLRRHALAADEPARPASACARRGRRRADRVPRAPGLEREPGRDLDPRVRGRERDDLAEALGVAGGEQQAREAAPVVAGEVGPLDARARRAARSGRRRRRRARSGRRGASVQPKPRRSGTIRRRSPRQPLDHAAPLVPVLRPAVDEQQRLAGAGLGDVHAQPAHLDEAVLDPCDRREVVVMRRRAYGP